MTVPIHSSAAANPPRRAATAVTTRAIFLALQAHGISKAVVHFSGGRKGDGPDGFDFYDARGDRIEGTPFDVDAHEDFTSQGRGWLVYTGEQRRSSWPDGRPRTIYVTRAATPDEIKAAHVKAAMAGPIHDSWSALGVGGTIIWEDGDRRVSYGSHPGAWAKTA